MRVKLRAEEAGLSAISWESGQVVLRYPVSSDDKDKDGRRQERILVFVWKG